jgi:hypothetical protein
MLWFEHFFFEFTPILRSDLDSPRRLFRFWKLADVVVDGNELSGLAD